MIMMKILVRRWLCFLWKEEKKMKKMLMLMLVLSLLLIFCACGNQPEEPENLPVETTVQQTETQMQESDWERFRAHLQEKGDAVVEEDLSTDADSMIRKTVIKGKEDVILVRFEIINRANYNGYATFGEVTAQFEFPNDVQLVEVNFKTEISATYGSQKETSTYEGTYDWDISQYVEGDVVVGTAIYNYIDQNGNYTHKNETVDYQITGIIEPVCNALRKVLSESGLGITMADLGFVNY